MAALKGLSVQEFFDQFVSVDWWQGEPNIFVLAPGTDHSRAGGMYGARPTGQCRLFVDGKCSIHAAKPFECRAYMHSQTHQETRRRHEAVAKAWKAHQQQIRDLLDDDPVADEPESFFDSWGW